MKPLARRRHAPAASPCMQGEGRGPALASASGGKGEGQTTYRTGLKAEALCRLALRLKFYRIVASRYRSPFGEIDIVAKRGRTLAVIEVKARATANDAAEAVTPRQQERLARGAGDFLARHPRFGQTDIRFDVMLVARGRWPVHIKDAWRIGC